MPTPPNALSVLLEIVRRMGATMVSLADDLTPTPRSPATVSFGVAHLTVNGVRIPMTVKIPFDAIAAVPLVFIDQAGHPIAGQVASVTVTVADTSLATAQLTSDGQWVQITPLKTSGSSTVSYKDTSDNIDATLDFEVVEPNPASVSFNEGGAVLTPNPNPPADPAANKPGGATGGTTTPPSSTPTSGPTGTPTPPTSTPSDPTTPVVPPAPSGTPDTPGSPTSPVTVTDPATGMPVPPPATDPTAIPPAATTSIDPTAPPTSQRRR